MEKTIVKAVLTKGETMMRYTIHKVLLHYLSRMYLGVGLSIAISPLC